MTKSQAKTKPEAEGKNNDKLINILEFSTLEDKHVPRDVNRNVLS